MPGKGLGLGSCSASPYTVFFSFLADLREADDLFDGGDLLLFDFCRAPFLPEGIGDLELGSIRFGPS